MAMQGINEQIIIKGVEMHAWEGIVLKSGLKNVAAEIAIAVVVKRRNERGTKNFRLCFDMVLIWFDMVCFYVFLVCLVMVHGAMIYSIGCIGCNFIFFAKCSDTTWLREYEKN
jgi:hypothetical protein